MIKQFIIAAAALLAGNVCLVAQAETAPGWQLAIHGTVGRYDAATGSAATAEKTFDLALLLTAVDDQAAQWLWLIEESGSGGWPWCERFGTWRIALQAATDTTQGPALLFEREDTSSVISLLSPLLKSPVEWAPEATWTAAGETYVVQKQESRGGRPLWRVAVSNGFGRSKTVWVDPDARLIRAAEQRVFMGQGEEYQLRWEVATSGQLSSEALTQWTADFGALEKLRGTLVRPPRTAEPELSAQQRQALSDALPIAQAAVQTAPLAAIVRQAERDLTLQTERAGDVEQLAAKFLGQPAAAFRLRGMGGESLTHADLAGHVTLLHFWEYRDEPLREPYGQVGYLEFLYSQRQAKGLRVFGVAVDGRLSDERTRPAALQSVRKLKSFMNLSYPVLLDEAAALKNFGDPRPAGAELPLWVLVGRDGRIVHYQVGHYEVDRQLGLKVLDDAVGRALSVAP